MFDKIKIFYSENEYLDAISFHSATDTLHDYMKVMDENLIYTYIVVTK
jgi:hypothetical protein